MEQEETEQVKSQSSSSYHHSKKRRRSEYGESNMILRSKVKKRKLENTESEEKRESLGPAG